MQKDDVNKKRPLDSIFKEKTSSIPQPNLIF